MKNTDAGFSLVELLAAITIGSLVMAAGVGVLSAHNRRYTREELLVDMEENARMAMNVLTDTLRAAGDGVPEKRMASWVPWVSDFTTNPLVAGTSPATVSVARCFPQPVAYLASSALVGATSVRLTSNVPGSSVADLLDTGSRRLVLFDDTEHAHVTAVSGDTVTIDTDPLVKGNQGIQRGYPSGTPICRVDVLTFGIETNDATGQAELRVDENHGSGAVAIAEGITDLRVTTVEVGRAYEVVLTGTTPLRDPVTGSALTVSLSSHVTLRN